MKARIGSLVLTVFVVLIVTMPTRANDYGIVQLSAVTPAPGLVAGGDTNVTFTMLDFVVGAQDVTVQEIVISRGGESTDENLSAIALYYGSVLLGSPQTLADGKAVFRDLNWTLTAYTTNILTIKADVAEDAEAGHTIQLGIASSNDITSTLPFSGDFPIMGAPMEVVAEETPVFLSFLPIIVRAP